MMEIVKTDGLYEVKVKINEEFWVSIKEYEEFKEKLENLIEEYKI